MWVITELKKKYHLLDESKKKIHRYTNIINKHSIINDNVYSKLQLYKDRINYLSEQIINLEKKLIIIIEKIISDIDDYVKNSNNYLDILATNRLNLLKNKKNIEIDKEKEKELSDEIEKIVEQEKSIMLNIKSIKNSNNEFDLILNSCKSIETRRKNLVENRYFKDSNFLKSIETDFVNNFEIIIITNNIKKKKEINDKIISELIIKQKELIEQKDKIFDDRIKITSNVEHLVDYIRYKYNDIPLDIKNLFSNSIPLILENKKFDKNKLTNGKYFLKQYINLYHPSFVTIYGEFIIHYDILSKFIL